MKVTIEFETNNACFEDDFDGSVEFLLDQVLPKIKEQVARSRECVCDAPEAGDKLLDPNGNTVGSIEMKHAPPEDLFVLRLYDMFDGWIDLTGPISKEEADKRWNHETANGTKNTKYDDGDYYKVFPADTRMIVTPEFLGR